MPVGEPRQMLEEHLAQAENAVALDLEHIARQRRILAELTQDHHETAAAAAEEPLKTFLETQALHEYERDRLRRELGVP